MNPLLRQNDPRFQNRLPADEQGSNRFAEDAAAGDVGREQTSAGNVFQTSSGEEAAPYQPEFLATQGHRGKLLLALAGLALAGNLCAGLVFIPYPAVAWILPVLALFPAGAAAVQAWEDLRAIRLGAMDAAGLMLSRMALWLGFAAMLLSLAVTLGLVMLALRTLEELE